MMRTVWTVMRTAFDQCLQGYVHTVHTVHTILGLEKKTREENTTLPLYTPPPRTSKIAWTVWTVRTRSMFTGVKPVHTLINDADMMRTAPRLTRKDRP